MSIKADAEAWLRREWVGSDVGDPAPILRDVMAYLAAVEQERDALRAKLTDIRSWIRDWVEHEFIYPDDLLQAFLDEPDPTRQEPTP